MGTVPRFLLPIINLRGTGGVNSNDTMKKHQKIVVGIAVGALIISGFVFAQKWEIIDGNLHVTSRSSISAWNRETKIWKPLIQTRLAPSDSVRRANAEIVADLMYRTIVDSAPVNGHKLINAKIIVDLVHHDLVSSDSTRVTNAKLIASLIHRDLSISDSIRRADSLNIVKLQKRLPDHKEAERSLISIYHNVKDPETPYNMFLTWVSLLLQDDRDYTRQEVVVEITRKKD